MLEKLVQLDKDIFIYLNGLHKPWLDTVMFLASERFFWIPLYAFILFLILKIYGKKSWIIFIGISVTLMLADQITSSIMKPYFARLRPSHDITLKEALHIINDYRGSQYGFASGHAANAFGAAMFCWLLFRHRYKAMVWGFAWAAMISYTRIYLGVHFPGDIVVGSVVGLLSGWVGYRLVVWIRTKFEKPEVVA